MVDEPSDEKHLSLIHVCKIRLTKEISVFSYTAKIQYRKSKQIFTEKELHGLSPNFHIHVSVRDCRKICGPILGIYKSLTDT